ncbi:MAG: hypothetical protein KGY76_04245 [Candidatus Thermoplasmatota archaeon]|nr:hypothetical protein [Candidatus Thermoplasmatota archaeon]
MTLSSTGYKYEFKDWGDKLILEGTGNTSEELVFQKKARRSPIERGDLE